jgi:hypothetical protein
MRLSVSAFERLSVGAFERLSVGRKCIIFVLLRSPLLRSPRQLKQAVA